MIPLSVPNLAGNEWKYIKDCLDTNWVSSVGSYVDKFEESVAAFTKSAHAISTSNGTAAIHIALLLSEVTQGDLVIVPNITFIAPVNCITYVGAKPLLVDIDPETWQMDIPLLERYLGQNTEVRNNNCYHIRSGERIKAIMPVHVLGNMCDMNAVMALAEKFHLAVIEDATEALGSQYNNQSAGTIARFGCLSFNGNKIITTGGGGMLLTNDAAMAKKAKHLTTQAKSDPFEYVHDDIGYNYRLVNVLSAMGVAQMEQLPGFIKRKKEISELYISELAASGDISFQKNTVNVIPNNWLFTILSGKQKAVIHALTEKKIQVRPLWVPMNQLSMFKDCIYINEHSVAQAVYSKSISLPCSSSITDEEIHTVINTILSV
ncbi:MAG: LegC family aminotransferase [Bacteroidota bacterium]